MEPPHPFALFNGIFFYKILDFRKVRVAQSLEVNGERQEVRGNPQ